MKDEKNGRGNQLLVQRAISKHSLNGLVGDTLARAKILHNNIVVVCWRKAEMQKIYIAFA